MSTFQVPAIDKKDFVNGNLFNDLIGGRYPGLSYTYSKDHDPHNKNYILSCGTTSLSELDGDEPGIVEEYLYNTEKQRDDDAFQLRLLSFPIFEEI